ncbi:hypothetical protein B0J13DRAFT_608679 [Dactylonectria estremocensis]|uniref:NACHT-NTPase and P-loop NTPases N-terminal domain-containing protein n=1 Tax=Dactylonectria estremocensis TaxID=1079267 RepID=A0A9P9END1_9HYPO|nr:hypothetical protein B0J13DRAFT_608679 [Dactylonectria estremocensis]
MAEALGFVSSVIAVIGVAGKLGTSAFTLKRLWDEVQNVPETIHQYIEELEVMSPALEGIESELQRTDQMLQSDGTAKLIFKKCQEAVTGMEEMVSDMQTHINSARKAKIGSALTRMQPSIIMCEFRALRERERAEAAAQVCLYEENSQRSTLRQPRTDKEWSPTLRSIPWQNTRFPWSFTYQTTDIADESHPVCIAGDIRVHQARLRLPSWLLQNAWDLQFYRSYHGWNFHLKPWNTRSDNSEVFRYARAGRTDLLLEAFNAQRASLYDRDQRGWTLLDAAILSSRLKCIRVLNRMELKLSDVSATIIRLVTSLCFTERYRVKALLDLFGILIEEGGLCDYIDDNDPAVTYHKVPAIASLKFLIWEHPEFLDLAFKVSPRIQEMVPTSWFGGIVWELVDPQLVLDIVKRDLEEYIRCEMAMCRGKTYVEANPDNHGSTRFTPSGPSLVLLKRGSSPLDWQFEWDPCVETFAGEFWAGVETPHVQDEVQKPMPGAWRDDDVSHNTLEQMEMNLFPGRWYNIGAYTDSDSTIRWYYSTMGLLNLLSARSRASELAEVRHQSVRLRGTACCLTRGDLSFFLG